MSVNIERLKELWEKRNDSQYAYLILKEELSIVMPAIIRELEAGRKLEFWAEGLEVDSVKHLREKFKDAVAEYREVRGDDGT